MYIIGYLELMFCAITSFQGLSLSDFSGDNGSDLFAAIFLLISFSILAFIPLKLMYVVIKFNGELDSPEIEETYGYLYEDLSTKSAWTASFNFLFMQRRTLFVLIII